jgi:hypothetical protein
VVDVRFGVFAVMAENYVVPVLRGEDGDRVPVEQSSISRRLSA